MKSRFLLCLTAALTAALPSVGQTADEAGDTATAADENENRKVAFRVGTGLEYDSNVAVLELDATSGEGDMAALVDLGVGFNANPTERFNFAADYNFSDMMHEEFDEYDVRIQRGSATGSFDFGRVDIGASYHHALADLDGDDFLTLSQTSPFVTKLIGERLFLRLAYAYTDKDFATSPGRDATTNSFDTEVFVFVDGVKTYLSFGYRYDDEDAIDPQFDFAGNRFKAQFARRVALASREITVKTYLRLEDRDYLNPTLSIGEVRDDRRLQLEAVAEIPLTARIETQISYKYSDNQSNLPSLDFDENVLTVSFSADF
jgi:hypothetical protein